MEWLQFFFLILTLLGTFYYTNQRIDVMQSEFKSETKDFHGRLCALEERYLNFMMRKHEKD